MSEYRLIPTVAEADAFSEWKPDIALGLASVVRLGIEVRVTNHRTEDPTPLRVYQGWEPIRHALEEETIERLETRQQQAGKEENK